MPHLQRIGKDKVINHHHDVPFKVLEKQYSFGDEGSENMIIHGDNLEGLKSLLPQYEGKVKCIYIDPPYNTGNEGRVYNDNMNHPKIKKWLGNIVGKEGEDFNRHDKWLCMMYPRLKLLHKLLRDDGIIFISIDDNEQANLKLMMDEIFGIQNMLASGHWRRVEGKPGKSKYIGSTSEYVVIYSKNKSIIEVGLLPMGESGLKEYRYEDINGKFRRGQIFYPGRGIYNYGVQSPYGNIISGDFTIKESDFKTLDKEGKVYWAEKGDHTPYAKIYLEDKKGIQPTNTFGKEFGSSQFAVQQFKLLFPNEEIAFDNPKPTKLIENLCKIANVKDDDIVLDSFAGSGTTAHAVLNLNKQDGGNRKFILLELMDYADTITAERVKRVINGYGEGTKIVSGTGGGFSYYTLGESLFDEEDNLNETIDLEIIKQYIRYTETKTTYIPQSQSYFLGRYKTTDYYFYYEHNRATVLDLDFLASMPPSSDYRLIYADVCHLGASFLTKHKIIFKKIPRDITRF